MIVDWLWLLPLIPLVGSLLCGVVHGLVLRQRAKHPSDADLAGLAGWIGVFAIAGAFVLSVAGFLQLWKNDSVTSLVSPAWDWIHVGGGFDVSVAMVFDRLSSAMCLVITGVGLLIHIYATGYMKGDPGYAKFFSFLNLFVVMMLVLVLSGNLVGTFVGWEGVGLCSYLLIGFWYKKQDGWPAIAAQKAFVANRIGDACLLIGMFLLVTTLGTLDLAEINTQVLQLWQDPEKSSTLAWAALLLFGGACGKSAQIPLFVWLPDAMAGPTPVSALIHAATMVTSGIYLVVRLNPLFAVSEVVLLVIAIVGVLTAFVAGTAALVQRDLKKVLAYSTVSQLGYMFLALGSGAWVAAFFHLVTHAFFKALLFLGAGSVIHGMHDEQDMHRMGGLRRHMPRTFVTFAAGAAALSGLPLLSGYFSKDEILAHAFAAAAGSSTYYLLWGLGVATAAVTAFYSWRMVALTFFGEERFDVGHVHPHESPASMTGPLFVLAFLSLVGGLLNLPPVLALGSAIHSWLEPVVSSGNQILEAHHQGHLPHVAHSTEWILLALGAGIALVFAHKGFQMHRHGLAADERFAQKRPAAARLFDDAWGVDKAYTRGLIEPIKLGAYFLAAFVDQVVIDGVVNGLAGGARTLGGKLRGMADGSISSYGLWMGGMSGVLALLYLWLGS